ncbi:alginate lyase family protein [Luteibacter sahnii]|uniref:alginate lyase family protein n=1 Tax=Luteibacter sahnii TaxID=3021977 RepID=UPI002A6B708A|nr:alginate lyase family protein [Luteibacter sp. PPL193]MDY1547653.1 alginate lyase family protein [Luteibacter sp. PPL193]
MLAILLAAATASSCLAAPAPTPAALMRAAAASPADAPQAMPVIHTEGTLPHTGIHDRSAAAMRDFSHMLDLALAWRDGGDRPSLDRLAVYLSAWTQTYKPSFDPIDETGFGDVIAAYDVTAADLPPDVARQTRDFLRRLATGYLDQMDAHRGDPHGVWTNNWQSHRVKLAVLASVALHDDVLFRRARAAFVQQLSINVTPGGEVIDFGERDALHYVTYDLEPLTLAAVAARRRGDDWLTLRGRDGQTLAAALDWLLPYAEGKRHHDEFVHSSVPFDAARARAGLPGFAGPWDPTTAKNLYWTASLLDPRYTAVARTLSPTPPHSLWAYARPCER